MVVFVTREAVPLLKTKNKRELNKSDLTPFKLTFDLTPLFKILCYFAIHKLLVVVQIRLIMSFNMYHNTYKYWMTLKCNFKAKKFNSRNNKHGCTGHLESSVHTTKRRPLPSNSGNKCRQINSGKPLSVIPVISAIRGRRAVRVNKRNLRRIKKSAEVRKY